MSCIWVRWGMGIPKHSFSHVEDRAGGYANRVAEGKLIGALTEPRRGASVPLLPRSSVACKQRMSCFSYKPLGARRLCERCPYGLVSLSKKRYSSDFLIRYHYVIENVTSASVQLLSLLDNHQTIRGLCFCSSLLKKTTYPRDE